MEKFQGTIKKEVKCMLHQHMGRITLVEIIDADKTEPTEKEFWVIGRHRLDKGESIYVEYQTNKSFINWVEKYKILNEEGETKYSDNCAIPSDQYII